jgi:deazaflavin-dependent oxidoreductase (nitroreductase family)
VQNSSVQKPGPLAAGLNRVVGFLAARGLGPGYMFRLSVRGRKSGRIYSTPVNLLEHDGKLWLVSPRGDTQWSKNAEASGEVKLKQGKRERTYEVRALTPEERPLLLKLYLERWPGQVQPFFSVRAGAELSEYASIASQHPVFELLPV